MSADLTPAKVKDASDELLTLWANQYRRGTGAHTIAINEIAHRADAKRIRQMLRAAIASAIITGVIGLLFYSFRYVIFS